MKIDYVEFYGLKPEASVAFFQDAFGWQATAYGSDYIDFAQAGVGAGMERSTQQAPLIVLKTDDLEAALACVEAAGGEVTKAIFAFPGGRRFQFREPSGNELAVWCAVDEDEG